MRRPIKRRPALQGDEKYNSVNVAKLINNVMIRGQKETARKIVYAALDEIQNAKEGGGEQGEIF